MEQSAAQEWRQLIEQIKKVARTRTNVVISSLHAREDDFSLSYDNHSTRAISDLFIMRTSTAIAIVEGVNNKWTTEQRDQAIEMYLRYNDEIKKHLNL